MRLWHGQWDNIIPIFQFVPHIRKVVYTTNAIESMNRVLRKLTRNRRIFPNDDAALGLVCGHPRSLKKLEIHPAGSWVYNCVLFKRNALPITDTELKLMAAAAIIGESSMPKKGYNTPAATGTPSTL